ncbi:hypothetical protein [Mycoplasmopsis adleri]|uniref:hypothetical protein n=1 Tax=Mycoplasmopsis adleri TaxID=51362 RepID=UPI0038735FDD
MLYIILIAIVFAFLGIIFVQNTGIYGFGVDALSHGIARLSAGLTIKYTNEPATARAIFIVSQPDFKYSFTNLSKY